MNNSNKIKIIVFVIGVISLTVILGLVTYAWFKWRTSNEQAVNINLTASSTVTFSGGTDISGTLEPVFDKSEGVIKNIRVISNLSGNTLNLYLQINTLPTELQDVSFKWAIYKNSALVNDSDFSTYAAGDSILLVNNSTINTNSYDEYTLYLWIDANYNNDPSMSGKAVDFDLYATCETGALEEVSN